MNCPICKRVLPKDATRASYPSYPFCTDRCKLIDLGRWLDNRYQVPVEADEAEIEQLHIVEPTSPRKRTS
jgi:uncharacterized protein